ncbi:SAM-dependent methyltransferase [Nonomuraea sp. PA05]|uniref:SAM-dependent methyltransferase n=1 Tax=Nonomuraea sp. PA05 TaxID=2604466 RepID=UPI0011DA52A9|nr:SAM-dependent methyltransferase [Nonomuraea sp. PA05]TYB61879.1 SAM-dependent methyltransferase [Nonomuraea sp. PA05]
MSETELPGVDSKTPNAARIYNYFLGGKDNFAADRDAAETVLAMAPEVRAAAMENREFLVRAVEYLVGEAGVRQFIDVGAGIPAERPVHEVAQRIDPNAKVAYVDNDSVVLVHSRALLGGRRGTLVVPGDAREPEAILDSPELALMIDLDQPVAVILIAILHFVPDSDDPAGLVRRLLDRLPSGSHVVITHLSDGGVPDDPRIAQTRALYNGGLYFRSRKEVEGLFEGLDMVEPGLVGVGQWRRTAGDETSWWLGGVARKP